MLKGFKTFAVGLGLALVPQAISFVTGFDFTRAFGLSPNAATVVGVAMIALRAATSTALFASAPSAGPKSAK
jgi:hypothetical protein